MVTVKTKTVLLVVFGVSAVFCAGFYFSAFRQSEISPEETGTSIVVFDRVIELPAECYLLALPTVKGNNHIKHSCRLEDISYVINIVEYTADSLAHLQNMELKVDIENSEVGGLDVAKIKIENSLYPVYQICDGALCMLVQPALPEVMEELLNQLK